MAEKNETESTSKKLSSFVEKNKKIFLVVLIIAIVAIVALICVEVASNSTTEKNLAKIDAISYSLTDKSASLEADELQARKDIALKELEPFTKKGGIAGVRANLLSAEIEFQNGNTEKALDFYKAVANKGKKSYTAPIAYYNMGTCYEKLNNLDAAAENFKKAADDDGFVLQNHAKFSYARVLETSGKYNEAVAVYTGLNDKSPDDNWAKLAKTRIITLKAEGKVE